MVTSTSDRYTGVERRVVQGEEALIRAIPDEVYVEWRPGRPVYFGVRVGDRLKDADRDVESARIREWEVREITPERVVAAAVDTGESREWGRRELEQALVLQQLATNLSAFATVAVHEIGRGAATDPEEQDAGRTPRRPYVIVLAYGNNGERYSRRYRFVESDDARTLEPWDEDLSIGRLSAEVRATLDERVREALVADGYRVVSEDGEVAEGETLEVDDSEGGDVSPTEDEPVGVDADAVDGDETTERDE